MVTPYLSRGSDAQEDLIERIVDRVCYDEDKRKNGIKRGAFDHYRRQRDVFGAVIPLNSHSGAPAMEQETDGNEDSKNDVD